MTKKIIVGSEEWCSLPGLGLPAIKARVDSGAATSSLHAFNIVPFQRDEARWISFEVHPLQNDRSVVIRHESPVLEQRGVRNTSGITETRYVIREQLVLGEESWPIELTLTNRDALDRMLAAQAELNRLVLLTADPQLSTFPCRTLW
ncbi:RimK/LysX family protein [Synechococcus sp. W2B2]|uniref:putative ATP-dependent zinc protease n=1 Tax=unclassified Synechococcus TaxID=2626047 RepID=UPI0002F488E0|nr:RimK/LysX family protein [Synechococcus sp. WH 7805]